MPGQRRPAEPLWIKMSFSTTGGRFRLLQCYDLTGLYPMIWNTPRVTLGIDLFICEPGHDRAWP